MLYGLNVVVFAFFETVLSLVDLIFVLFILAQGGSGGTLNSVLPVRT